MSRVQPLVPRRLLTTLCGCFGFSLLTGISGCMGYVPGRQTYWDIQVQEMCKNDGGTAIFEPVVVSQEQYRRLGGKRGVIPTPEEKWAQGDYPFVTRTTETTLNEKNPRVYRSETVYLRRADMKILAKSVSYFRVGGDIPSHGHPTHLSCPDQRDLVDATRRIFIIEGETK